MVEAGGEKPMGGNPRQPRAGGGVVTKVWSRKIDISFNFNRI